MQNRFSKINKYLWEIPQKKYPEMIVPARFYGTKKLLEETEDKAIGQAVNVTSLPGIVRHGVAMPDIHSGYGPPIGAVGASLVDGGVISPGFVGFDENCGVRLLVSEEKISDLEDRISSLIEEIFKKVPTGVGKGRAKEFSMDEMNNILEQGSQWIVEQGFGEKRDIERCEERGKLPANHEKVSKKAKKRGLDQVGTLGSGNHFIEIQAVEDVFDEQLAKNFDIKRDQVVVMIHTGSRGLGHQNCKDYLQQAVEVTRKNDFKLPDKNLSCFPFNSQEGQDFYFALGGACNFSFANRQMITHLVRNVWKNNLGSKLKLVYDVAHNTAKVEKHEIDGKERKLIVHRKGATRAFPPNHKKLPHIYKKSGQPVIMPGSMGTNSYLLSGVESGKASFYSTAHGAGRKMSRTKAREKFSREELNKEMSNKNIILKSTSKKGALEEAPGAYKNIQEIVEVVSEAGLAKKVAKLKPLAVIKG